MLITTTEPTHDAIANAGELRLLEFARHLAPLEHFEYMCGDLDHANPERLRIACFAALSCQRREQ